MITGTSLSFLLNPDKNSGNFLTVQDNNNQDSLTFKNNGSIILGDITTSCIEINGPDQTIYAYKNGDKLTGAGNSADPCG